jgi:hypothetical protein
MNHRISAFLRIFIITVFVFAGFVSCRKDIETPSVETSQVFGKWKWVASTGGGNASITPQSAGYDLEREYEANGVYKLFKDRKREEKLIFEFIEGTTINFESPQYLLKYRRSGLNRKEKFRENFSFQGSDTLFVQRDCDGCYVDTYVRQ